MFPPKEKRLEKKTQGANRDARHLTLFLSDHSSELQKSSIRSGKKKELARKKGRFVLKSSKGLAELVLLD